MEFPIVSQRLQWVQSALSHFGHCLIRESKRQFQASFRFLSILFDNADVEVVVGTASSIIPLIPIAKFAPLARQVWFIASAEFDVAEISSRLSSQQTSFQKMLHELMLCLCLECPQEVSWLLLSMANGGKIPKATKGKDSFVIDKDRVNLGKCMVSCLVQLV